MIKNGDIITRVVASIIPFDGSKTIAASIPETAMKRFTINRSKPSFTVFLSINCFFHHFDLLESVEKLLNSMWIELGAGFLIGFLAGVGATILYLQRRLSSNIAAMQSEMEEAMNFNIEE